MKVQSVIVIFVCIVIMIVLWVMDIVLLFFHVIDFVWGFVIFLVGLMFIIPILFIMNVEQKASEKTWKKYLTEKIYVSPDMKKLLEFVGHERGKKLEPNLSGFWEVMLWQIQMTRWLPKANFVPINMGFIPGAEVFFAMLDPEYTGESIKPTFFYMNIETGQLYRQGTMSTDIRNFEEKMMDRYERGEFPRMKPKPTPSIAIGSGGVMFSPEKLKVER